MSGRRIEWRDLMQIFGMSAHQAIRAHDRAKDGKTCRLG